MPHTDIITKFLQATRPWIMDYYRDIRQNFIRIKIIVHCIGNNISEIKEYKENVKRLAKEYFGKCIVKIEEHGPEVFIYLNKECIKGL